VSVLAVHTGGIPSPQQIHIMTITLTVPDKYGYVILTTCVWSLFLVPSYMGMGVIKARDQFKIPLPNLYATPGYHKEADAFNRIQRGHQNMFESLTAFAMMNLIGGLKYPSACSVYALLYSTGCILYQLGYGDTSLDVKTARYKKGGAIKLVGFFGAMGATVSLCADLCKWW
jgi:glutathione S-transferase